VLTGKLVWWSGTRNFGFIEVPVREGSGTRIDRYFLHRTRIEYRTVEEPRVGNFIRFGVDPQIDGDGRPAGRFPLAVNARVFETKEQADASMAEVL
jgi:cold shock CspA family protein